MLFIPELAPELQPILPLPQEICGVRGQEQLLAYYVKGTDVDQPRNLAKSVIE